MFGISMALYWINPLLQFPMKYFVCLYIRSIADDLSCVHKIYLMSNILNSTLHFVTGKDKERNKEGHQVCSF